MVNIKCRQRTGYKSQRRDSQKNITGGGILTIEPNPKTKKIPILGQFGILKKYIHIKHAWYPKNIVFFLFKHRPIQENYRYIIYHNSQHHTLHIN